MVFRVCLLCFDLRQGFTDSPLFNGTIQSVGPRYCPSIETKLNTFAYRTSHHLFLEPEGETTTEFYLNGFSSSLPWDVQLTGLRLIEGFENVRIFRPGYAIEYDYFPPTQLYHTLETKLIQGLYFAGQINGTTGYEEAAAQGLTREQIAEKVKKLLLDASLVKDPTVTVSLSNLHYSMMGEVAKPGQYAIDEEKVTILDAISKAGDLTIQGRRQDVMVLRQENGHQKIYKIDLCSGKDIFNSPAYYLQQNDVVYVTPNDTKKRSSTLNGNTVQSTGFWMSISSLIVTILTFLKVN